MDDLIIRISDGQVHVTEGDTVLGLILSIRIEGSSMEAVLPEYFLDSLQQSMTVEVLRRHGFEVYTKGRAY